jgi:hypothetical protein
MILNTLFRILYNSRGSNKPILIVISFVIAALIVDTSLIKIYDLISKDSSFVFRIVTFTTISITCVTGQYLILEFVKQKSRGIGTSQGFRLNAVHKTVRIAQYSLMAILVIIILQVVLTSHYNVIVLFAATTISYGLAIGLMALLAYRFFSWFRSNRNSVVILYGLASMMLAINVLSTLVFVNDILLSKPTEVRANIVGTTLFIEPYSLTSSLNDVYFVTTILSFILMWIATILLLHHHSQRLGRVKYWIIVSIPLVYFLSQFLSLFLNLFPALFQSQPIFYNIFFTMIFTLTKPAGGVLFAVAFWIVVRSFSPHNIVRDYMIISAFGFILLFVSNQAVVLVSVPYPPFGVATISFLGLSSYLIFVGIYASAISVSGDTELRKSIRKYAITESKLLDSIGSAQMEQQIQRRVIDMMRQNQDRLSNETGVEPSLSEGEVKQYLHDVLEEVRKGKRQNGDK